MRILYIADLGEDIKKSKADPDSLYGQLLKNCQDGETRLEIIADDLATTDPAHILAKCLLNGTPDLIVGQGFAAVFALLIGRATQSRTILLNPKYPAYRYLPYEIPDYEFSDLLASFEFKKLCWDDPKTTLNNVFVILGEDDDVIDAKRTDKYFVSGNCFYVRGGHNPKGDDFKDIFKNFVTHVFDDPEDIRKMLDTYKNEGAFEKAEESPIDWNAADQGDDETSDEDKSPEIVVLPGNDRIVVDVSAELIFSDDEEKKEKDAFDLNRVKVDEVTSEDGNIVIKWHLEDIEYLTHVLYLFYKDGTWYRDEEGGLPSKTYILEAVLSKAAKKFLEQTEITDHIGQDYWGWMW